MIFVTVGTQGPFDRLVAAVEEWAERRDRRDVFAQIGPSELVPRHIEWVPALSPTDFKEKMRGARAIVSHAGMGTILSALQLQKPLLVMPRRADLGEQRNDHQLATVRRFSELGVLTAAYDGEELGRHLDGVDRLPVGEQIRSTASEELLARLRAFLQG